MGIVVRPLTGRETQAIILALGSALAGPEDSWSRHDVSAMERAFKKLAKGNAMSGQTVTDEMGALLTLGRNLIVFEVRQHNGGRLNDIESRLACELETSDVAHEESGNYAMMLRNALGLTAESDYSIALSLYWRAGQCARLGDLTTVRRFVRRIAETFKHDPRLMTAVTGIDLTALNS